MDPSPRRPDDAEPPSASTADAVPSPPRRSRRRRRKKRSDRTPPLHARCEKATGALLIGLAIFTPWAFGTTQAWSLAVAHAGALALGVLLAVQWLVRWQTGFDPFEPDAPEAGSSSESLPPPTRPGDWVTTLLGLLTLLLLGTILVSVLNARADFDEVRRDFDYLREPIRWLPHSYDRGATWAAFWQVLGLACVFWAGRDWLRERPASATRDRDRRDSRDSATTGPGAGLGLGAGSWSIPPRIRLLLWALCLSGIALAVVGILQRADGSNRLLWILESRSQKPPEAVFGPWSYRTNAAQYFNLLWPVCLGFWLWTQAEAAGSPDPLRRRLDGPRLLLLPAALAMAACPSLSGSRGGTLIALYLASAAVALLLLHSRRGLDRTTRRLTLGALLGTMALVALAGWRPIQNQLRRTDGRFPCDLSPGQGEFTLLARARLPAGPDRAERLLAGLVPGSSSASSPAGLRLVRTPQGGLAAALETQPPGRLEADPLPDSTPRDREVIVALVRKDGLRLFVDGTEVGGGEAAAARPPGWDAALHPAWLVADPEQVTEVALLDLALLPAELTAAGPQPFSTLADSLGRLRRQSMDLPLGPAEVQTALGTKAETSVRKVDLEARWLLVRRTEDRGPIGFRRALGPVARDWRGQPTAVFIAWNPTDLPLHLVLSVDGGPQARVEVPPRAERELRVPVRIPHSGPPGHLEIALGDEDGSIRGDAEPGTQLFIRNLRLDASARAVSHTLQPLANLNPLDFSDRVTGRSSIDANARRMAADYPVWGSGAGTFASLYQLYREPGQVWAAYAHNDWLELRITLGWTGLALGVGLLAVLAGRSWKGPGTRAPTGFLALGWLGLAGLLAHAIHDFPFQIHSVAFLFVLLAAVLSVVSTRGARA